jgi:hypothetical protein
MVSRVKQADDSLNVIIFCRSVHDVTPGSDGETVHEPARRQVIERAPDLGDRPAKPDGDIVCALQDARPGVHVKQQLELNQAVYCSA